MLREPRGKPEISPLPTGDPAADEVLLRMEACGLCHSDLFVCGLARLPVAPFRLGHEGIGRRWARASPGGPSAIAPAFFGAG
jgi:D-arabinose 1-dehydrogenase-like Zn-dependent alcohol dehydrogenase